MASPSEFSWPVDAASTDEMRRALTDDGILLVRDVLSADEIAKLREIVTSHLTASGRRLSLGKTQPNASLQVPELSFLFAHPKIVEIMSRLLGSDNVVFTGHCDIHMNMLSGWHKDSGETVPGGYFKGDYMDAEDCRVYKVAIYLQDTGERDSFSARLGSHRKADLTSGELVKAYSRRGDLVIFDVRLSHTGQLPDLVEKTLKAASLGLNCGSRDKEDNRAVSALKQAYWKLMGRRNRLSTFFTYGADNRFTEDFASANMNRQNRQGANAEGLFSGDLIAGLADRDVKVAEVVRTSAKTTS